MTKNNDLLNHVKAIANNLEMYYNADVEAIANNLDLTVEEVKEDGYDLYYYVVSDGVLDIEYRLNSDKTLKSVSLLVAFGGPNIWIDTQENAIIGAWWGSYEKVYFDSSISDEINSIYEEIFNC